MAARGELFKYYERLVRHLEKIPKKSMYRTQVEQFANRYKTAIDNPEDTEISQKFLQEAKSELKLIDIMEKYKVWEPLDEKPPGAQWKWP